MTIVNLTPHTLNFVFNETKIDIEPSGSIARVSAKDTPMNPINGIPVFKTEYGEIENLPAPCEGKIYVVSSLVAARCPSERTYLSLVVRFMTTRVESSARLA